MELAQKQLGRPQTQSVKDDRGVFAVSSSTERVMRLRAEVERTFEGVAEHLDRLHGPRPREIHGCSKDGPAPVIGELEGLSKALDLLEEIWNSLRDNLDAIKAI